MLNFNARAALARRNFRDFVAYTKPDYVFNWHHNSICDKLDQFAKGKIKKLMIFVPPQHGKSELATRRFPAFQLGLNPKTKIVVCSYSATLAASFNRDIQRVIDHEKYYSVFEGTKLNESNVATSALGSYLRNSEIFEVVDHRGFVKTVGVGGSLTGTPVDIGIIDDPFKDREEAMSIRIRDKVYSWYTDVFSTRLHNGSQQLIIMTRWDQDDLAGRILATESDWEVITYQAIKERITEGDPRSLGEALWPEKHSLERLLHIRDTSPFTFNSLYQQDPKASKEALVYPEWNEYTEEPEGSEVIGLDFGFSNDPTAIIKVTKVKRGNMRPALYLRELCYKTGMLNSDIISVYSHFGYLKKRTFAEVDPKTIAELKKLGLNITQTIKGPGSIIAGINWVKEHDIFVHKDSHNLKTELNNYQWVMYGGEATNETLDSYNHLLDALRYTKPGFANTSTQPIPVFQR